MHREKKIIALKDVLGDDCWQKSDEIIFHCKNPKGCNGTHHKKKLSVNLKTDAFHCWVCGWGNRGSIEPILRLKRDTDYYAEYVSEHGNKEKPKEVKQYDTPTLPSEYRSLSVVHRSPWFNQAMAYLANRGLSHSDVILYKLGYCEDGPYRNRIIVPSFDEYGELNFVVGRSFYQTDMKYKHGNYSKDIIFNDYMIDWSEPITLVEGPFDMMKARPKSIPIMGVFLQPSSKLFQKIVQKKVPVYIALDNDAMPNILRLAEDLMRHGVEAHVVTWKDFKDPGDMPKGKLDEFKKNNSLQLSTSFDVMKFKVFHSASLR
jgi:DNA primase